MVSFQRRKFGEEIIVNDLPSVNYFENCHITVFNTVDRRECFGHRVSRERRVTGVLTIRTKDGSEYLNVEGDGDLPFREREERTRMFVVTYETREGSGIGKDHINSTGRSPCQVRDSRPVQGRWYHRSRFRDLSRTGLDFRTNIRTAATLTPVQYGRETCPRSRHFSS